MLDPAGTAVQSGLKHLGYENVEQIRIGKYIELKLKAENELQAQEQLHKICDQLLANPVIENYRFDLQILEPSLVGLNPWNLVRSFFPVLIAIAM